MHVGLRVIRDEHRTLAAVVDGLSVLAQRMAGGQDRPDFPLLEAIIAYIEGFPARLHHPKEDSVLFPAVQRRTRDLDDTIAELHRQHEEDYERVTRLRAGLARWQADPAEAAAFAADARDYARFTMHHMTIEESRILHALPALLTEEDWTEIDRAFDANQDPMTAPELTSDYAKLFQRIVLLAPAPVGLG
ncbi:hemerythrin domain-containing protein [Azospirillum sp. TSO22-1]|uniref:hemerythrin domain-containing protein n=1 Tax=Azospirillum sp. TSO22-1 TaxID=716789 RepID=UPI000D60BFB8|nr:hemerythrin domain-containing protein [Azospirillum sp. TSO22-1]PWC31604.1 hypothetical protein TSO221_33610 [Azospirillum sp. TSO22-1]